MNAFVHIRDLRVEFRRDGQTVNAVNGVSFDVKRRGDGADWRVGFRQKRDPAGADAPAPATSSVLSGTLQVGDEEVLKMSASQLRRYRGGAAR
jgi:peptide/nickel transport system ATP-binding protein